MNIGHHLRDSAGFDPVDLKLPKPRFCGICHVGYKNDRSHLVLVLYGDPYRHWGTAADSHAAVVHDEHVGRFLVQAGGSVEFACSESLIFGGPA